MSRDDMQALAQIAQGDGELRVSKRLMRDLIAKAVIGTTGRAAAPSRRMAGSVQ